MHLYAAAKNICERFKSLMLRDDRGAEVLRLRFVMLSHWLQRVSGNCAGRMTAKGTG